jgi:hypothetical protein
VKFQATKGHLMKGSLHLNQTEKVREALNKRRKAQSRIKQLPKVALDWLKPKERKEK